MKAQMFNLYTIETVLLSTIETLFLNRKKHKFEVILCAAEESEDMY